LKKENDIIEGKKFKEVCTFKPKISEKPNVFSQEVDIEKEEVQDRLLRKAQEQKEKKEKIKKETSDQLINQYSFNPKIDEKSKQLVVKYGNIPIHERYQEIMKNRNENLQRLRLNMDQGNSKTTYKPEINLKSVEIANRKAENSQQNPYERLYNEAFNKKKGKHC